MSTCRKPWKSGKRVRSAWEWAEARRVNGRSRRERRPGDWKRERPPLLEKQKQLRRPRCSRLRALSDACPRLPNARGGAVHWTDPKQRRQLAAADSIGWGPNTAGDQGLALVHVFVGYVDFVHGCTS